MKFVLSIIVFIAGFAVNPLIAQNLNNSPAAAPVTDRASLTGKITDIVTGEALAGASVYLPDLRTGATTNAQGIYSFKNIPGGKHLVEVSFTGYAPLIESIYLSAISQKDFALTRSYVENEAVTVTGVSAATSVKRTPVPVNIVKKDELFRAASTNLIDALSRTPGVSQVSTGPAVSKPFIRGLGYNRVVIVNDGIRQEGQQWGDEHGIEIDEYNVSKAEILKGPASLMYGSDALAGVVNIISIVPVAEGTIKGNLFSNYQSNNRLRGFHADLGGNQNGFIWGAYGSYKAAADYKNKYDGYVFNSKFNEKAFGGYLGLNRQWGYTHVYASMFDQHVGLVEGERDAATGRFIKPVDHDGVVEEEEAAHDDFTSTDPFIPRQRIRHFKVATDNSFRLGDDRLTFTLGFQRNQREEFGNVLDPKEQELYFNLKTINYNLQYHFAEKNHWKTSIGVNGMQQNNQNKGEEALIPEYDLFDVGAFIYTQKEINKMTISGGLRYDHRSLNSKEMDEDGDLKFEQFKRKFDNVSGSIGLSYRATKDLTLKFNMARGFRAPSIPELASNGAHEGTNRYEYGQRDLKSETSFQVDGGVEFATPHVSLAANLFYNSVQNFIYSRKLQAVGGGDSLFIADGDELFAFRYNQHNATLYGAEMNIDIHPHPLDWLHLENTFSYVRGTLSESQDGSRNLPFIPAARLINEVKVDLFPKSKTFSQLYVKAELDNTFAQNEPFTGYNTETKTSGYTLLNAGFGGNVMSKNKVLFSLFFSANNIGDVAWQSHLSRLKYAPENEVTGRIGVFGMGRNFSVKLNIPLSFTTN